MEEGLHHNFLKQIDVACETECHGKGAFFVLKVYNQCICDVDSKIIFQNELEVQTWINC